MKITKARLKEIIKEEILTERLKRFKVYVSGEREPLVLMGKNEREVKKLAYMMIRNSSVKIRKVVKEGKLNEFNKAHFLNLIEKEIESLKGQIIYAKKALSGAYGGVEKWEAKEFKAIIKDKIKDLRDTEKHYKRVQKLKEGTCGYGENGELGEEPAGPHLIKKEKFDETWDSPQAFSSREAQKVVDGALRNYAKDLRKVQYRVVKDWMSKAKGGVIDFFDIQRGLTTGDISRAHPYETEFLQKVLTKDKIIDRFRKYFGGKKGFEKRRKNQRGMGK